MKIGGTDIIYAKQQYSSTVQPAVVQKKLKDMADEFFVGGRINEKEKVWSFSSPILFLFSSIFGKFYKVTPFYNEGMLFFVWYLMRELKDGISGMLQLWWETFESNSFFIK